MRRMTRAAILSDDGWPYASSLPIDANDPGRYHALFGRDSLIYSLQVMPEQPDVARATLRVLAALQGQREDPEPTRGRGRSCTSTVRNADPRFAEIGMAGARRGTPLLRFGGQHLVVSRGAGGARR